MIYQKGQHTTGFTSVDAEFDRVYKFLRTMQTGVKSISDSISNNNIITTQYGGIAVKVNNGSGVVLEEGYMVVPSSTSQTVLIAPEDSYNICGVIYQSIPVYGSGYMVIEGWCKVYFNSNGTTAGDYFRMSKSTHTANNDSGKAESTLVRPDALFLKGQTFQTIPGEGLADCLLIR